MDPAQWMALLQQGDEKALERLLTHYDGMLRYCLLYTSDAADE